MKRFFIFLRAWSLVYAATVALAFLRALLTVDGIIIDSYQNWICDPLQFRGISLKLQVRVLCFAAGLAILLPFSWWCVPSSLLYFYQAVFFKYEQLDAPPDEEAVRRNPQRFFLPGIVARVIFFLLAVITSGLTHFWFQVPVALMFIALACDPKPPRPRRIRLPIPSTEGV